MAVVVIGGNSRSVGKTSVVAGIIAAMPEKHWLAIKITQYGHGICSANGAPCDCVTDDHTMALMEERDVSGDTDTSRFIEAGASRVLWARTRQGYLAELMPRLREQIGSAKNVIIESNSVVRFLRPDLYMTVLDPSVQDFKSSAKEFLDRADAVIIHESVESRWHGISLAPISGKPIFKVTPPPYVTREILETVRAHI